MFEQNIDKKNQEQNVEQKFQDKFNSITEKSTPVNQNQEHNIKKEGMHPMNQKK